MREPGIAPRDSRKSRINATRMEVSCRQTQRAQPITPMPTGPLSSTGAVESWEPAAPSAGSESCDASVGVLSVVLMSV